MTGHLQKKKIAAVVLAAGQSKRMGGFKPLLEFGSTTVIGTCIKNLRDGGASEMVVVVSRQASEIIQHLKNESVAIAVNNEPESEMSVSIVRGVELVSRDAAAILISPADIPAVTPEVVRAIITNWQKGARLVVPEHGGRGGHPVLIDASYRDELLALEPTTGLRGFFHSHRDEVLRLPVNSPYIARDLDTWDDYRQLHEEIFGIPPSKRDQ